VPPLYFPIGGTNLMRNEAENLIGASTASTASIYFKRFRGGTNFILKIIFPNYLF
jgi:hypothetical protein